MADMKSNLHVASQPTGAANFAPVIVSKDENANAVANGIFVDISDGVNTLDLLVVDSAYGATPSGVPVVGKYEVAPTTYADGDATPFLTDENGRLQVDVSSLTGLPSKDDDSAFALGTDKVSPIGGIYVSAGDNVDDGDVGALRMSQDRLLYTRPFDGTNLMPMMDAEARAGYTYVTDGTNTQPTMDDVSRAGYVEITDGTNTMPTMDVNTRAGFMQITDGVNEWSIDASGFGQVDIAAQSLTAIKVSKDANANSETNPIYVQVVEGVVKWN